MPAGDSYSSTANGGPTVTRIITKQVVPFNTSNELVDPDVKVTKKHEEWTTSKKIVNHKTKQVETRVQRQLILEDGRVVADSGPQVTTKTKEDVRTEESENSEHKTTGDDSPGDGYTLIPGSAQVVSEKTESTQRMTETKEENRQMHDERIRDLSGEELHQRIIVAPDDTNFGDGFCNFPGALTHYSSRSQKVVDKEEVKEVSQLKDGEMSTETTRTHHHEEAYDDEVPEEEAEEGMVPERSAETSRKIQYYTDPREFELAAENLREESRRSHRQLHDPYLKNSHQDVPAVTHKWLDDHFGKSSPLDDSHETTRTKSGGNRITIEMTGHRSSPSDLSPTDSMRKHGSSRDSTLRHKSSFERSDWNKSSYDRSPSPPISSLPRSNLRNTSSPFEVSSSSGSSRSKTPVKTFYLGEENTYNKDSNKNSTRRRTNKGLAEILKSNLTINGSNSYGRNYDLNHHEHYYKTSTSKYATPTTSLSRNGTFNSGPIYSNVRKNAKNTCKKIQVSMSDDEDDFDRFKTNRSHRDRPSSPYQRLERSATTLPRNLKTANHSKSLLIPISTPATKHYKSSESLLSPNYSNYSSTIDYGSTNSFKYSDHRSSPVYNHSAASTLKSSRRNDSFHKDDWNNSHYTDTYKTHKTNEYNGNKHTYHREETRNHYESNGKSNGSAKHSWNGSAFHKSKMPISPPESGYQSPLPPSPPISPLPRLIKTFNSDHYGSSSSISPPDSPHHLNTSSIRRSAGFPSGSTSRSKSSGDLRHSGILPSPTSFTPLSSPSELKTMGKKADHQKYYRVKPGDDGRSVVVQVRDWKGR